MTSPPPPAGSPEPERPHETSRPAGPGGTPYGQVGQHREMPVIRPDGSLQPRPAPTPATPADSRPMTVANAFGDIRRTGRWRCPRMTNVYHLFGDVVLDLREAELDGQNVSISSYGIFGDVKLIVPPGTRVDVSGTSIFGDQKIDSAAGGEPGGLRVQLSAHGVFGDVKVKVLEPGEREPKWWRRGS